MVTLEPIIWPCVFVCSVWGVIHWFCSIATLETYANAADYKLGALTQRVSGILSVVSLSYLLLLPKAFLLTQMEPGKRTTFFFCFFSVRKKTFKFYLCFTQVFWLLMSTKVLTCSKNPQVANYIVSTWEAMCQIVHGEPLGPLRSKLFVTVTFLCTILAKEYV